MAISAIPFLLPLMFQEAFGWSAVKSGLLVIAVFIGNIGIKPFTTPILRRFGFRSVLVVNGIAAVVSIALCGILVAGTPLVIVALVLCASGVFRSIGFTAYNTINFADVAPEQMSAANTLSSTVQQLTMGLGVAVGALALRVADPIMSVVGLRGSAGDAYHVAFMLVALLALLAIIESVRLPRHAGAQVTRAVGR